MSGGRGGVPARRPEGWPAAAWVVAFALFLGAAGVARDLYFFQSEGPPARERLATHAHSVLSPLLWAVIFLVVLRVTRRARPQGAGGARPIALAAALAAAHYAVEAAALRLVPPSPSKAITLDQAVTAYPTSMVITLGLLAGGLAVAQAGRRREQEDRAARLAADLDRARMQGLQSQLRPHFLFNVLQSVATLMHRDVPAARAMLARLRVLLERSLALEQAGQAPLRGELDLLRLYTDIQAVRFGARLRVEVELQGDAEDVPVPVLLLQPLVENAIRHAVEVRGEGTVRVRASHAGPGEPLHLEVSDPGAPGGGARPYASSGIGLANTRARLELLYGDAAALWMERTPAGGTVVHVRLPPAAPAPASDAE